MLYRKVKHDIEKWLQNSKDALLITGARQVGKSYIVRETLKENNVDYVEFNFIKQKKLIKLFESAIEEDFNKFMIALNVAEGRSLDNNTVIFFDEIQECKEVVTIIKFLVEHGGYKYILSGSLLGVELTNLRSAPVGYMRTIDMYPLDLEEFLIANGLSKSVFDMLKESFIKETPIDSFVHESLIDAFYKYLIVGGMPEAVQVFLNTGDLNEVKKVHNKISREYKKDFTKYENEKKLKLINTYNLIPSELNMKNKRYTFTNLDKELHFDRYENSFNWLVDAGVALPVYNVTEYAIPLEASKKSNLFKLFVSDVGMLTSSYGSATIVKLLEKGNDINCGAMFENAIAQELKAHGFNLYYFNNKKHGEVDFVIEYDNSLLPLEIKSGKDYQKHSALSYFVSTNSFDKAIVLSNYNVGKKDNIIYLPIYMIMFLNNHFEIQQKVKIDLSNIGKRDKK